MKLLICTQTINKNDPILGFFHRWVEEFAKYFEHIHVICLKEGFHKLPKNVSVYSLGKENGISRIKYIIRFYIFLFRIRGTYDRVFVHMNPHYVLLGGLFWTVVSMPVFFWRNHARMNVMTQIAAFFAKKVFYTSPHACTSRYHHARQMPVGIDLNRFTAQKHVREKKVQVLFLGRLSPVKRVEIFIEAGKLLGETYEMYIYGNDPLLGQAYFTTLKNMAGENIFFHPAVKNEQTPDIYHAHDIYVNLTPEGSMDKTVLEAVACGTQVIVTNTSFLGVVPNASILTALTPKSLAEKITYMYALPLAVREKQVLDARNVVVEKHSLEKLAVQLHAYLTEHT